MLDEKDIELIGVEVGKVLEHNIMPQFDMIHEDIKAMKGEIGGMKGEIGGMKGEISAMKADITTIKATMVTKSYLDDKMADLKSELIAQDRKLEKKTDVLVSALVERRALKPTDVERLEQARVFPKTTG